MRPFYRLGKPASQERPPRVAQMTGIFQTRSNRVAKIEIMPRAFGQAVDCLRGIGAGKHELAHRPQRSLAMARESVRREDGLAELAGQFLQTRRKIDRWADAGEIQTVAASDIA